MTSGTLFHESEFKQLDNELWFAKKIVEKLTPIFISATDPQIRKERTRRAIIAGELDLVICGSVDGKSQNFSQAFERLYGEPLQPKPKRG
jgi:hypothetical protein